MVGSVPMGTSGSWARPRLSAATSSLGFLIGYRKKTAQLKR